MRLLEEEYVIDEVAFGFKPSGILSNCVAVSTLIQREPHGAYHIGVHVSVDGPVRARIVPRSDEN